MLHISNSKLNKSKIIQTIVFKALALCAIISVYVVSTTITPIIGTVQAVIDIITIAITSPCKIAF
jgi:hypothetical protein